MSNFNWFDEELTNAPGGLQALPSKPEGDGTSGEPEAMADPDLSVADPMGGSKTESEATAETEDFWNDQTTGPTGNPVPAKSKSDKDADDTADWWSDKKSKKKAKKKSKKNFNFWLDDDDEKAESEDEDSDDEEEASDDDEDKDDDEEPESKEDEEKKGGDDEDKEDDTEDFWSACSRSSKKKSKKKKKSVFNWFDEDEESKEDDDEEDDEDEDSDKESEDEDSDDEEPEGDDDKEGSKEDSDDEDDDKDTEDFWFNKKKSKKKAKKKSKKRGGLFDWFDEDEVIPDGETPAEVVPVEPAPDADPAAAADQPLPVVNPDPVTGDPVVEAPVHETPAEVVPESAVAPEEPISNFFFDEMTEPDGVPNAEPVDVPSKGEAPDSEGGTVTICPDGCADPGKATHVVPVETPPDEQPNEKAETMLSDVLNARFW